MTHATFSHSDPFNGAFKGRGRRYAALLACPVEGGALRSEGDALRCALDASHVYPFVDGILRLAAPDQLAALDAASAAHEAACARDGWASPDEAAFKSLPQTALDGYPEGYWARQAVSTALLWRFLETVRRRSGILPVGPAGEAAILGAGFGWLAYGLDVAGYTTLAIDAYAGPRYGLGVYPIARYWRVHTDPVRPPLAPAALDVVIYQDGLARSGSPADEQAALRAGIAALRPGGTLIVIDALDPTAEKAEALRDRLGAAGLHLMDTPRRDGWRARLSNLGGALTGRSQPVPPVIAAYKPG